MNAQTNRQKDKQKSTNLLTDSTFNQIFCLDLKIHYYF